MGSKKLSSDKQANRDPIRGLLSLRSCRCGHVGVWHRHPTHKCRVTLCGCPKYIEHTIPYKQTTGLSPFGSGRPTRNYNDNDTARPR
jgi:hypothetical protein